MKKQDALKMVGPAKAKLIAAFPQYAQLIEDTEVYLLSSKDKTDKRNGIAAELSARPKAAIVDTASEAIAGKDRFAVVMYYQDIRPTLFVHYLFHEFGHVISIDANRELFSEAQEDVDQDKDTPLRNGSALWSELIAEVIAYRAEDGEPDSNSWEATARIEALMDEAVNTGYFEPYPFAFYCAMFFEDPTIIAYLYRHPDAAVGANNCDDAIMPYLENALQTVAVQLDKEKYWIIDRKSLCDLGNCVNDLWDYCANRHHETAMRAFAEYLRQSADTDKNDGA